MVDPENWAPHGTGLKHAGDLGEGKLFIASHGLSQVLIKEEGWASDQSTLPVKITITETVVVTDAICGSDEWERHAHDDGRGKPKGRQQPEYTI